MAVKRRTRVMSRQQKHSSLPGGTCNTPLGCGRRDGERRAHPALGCPTDTAPAPEAFRRRSVAAGALSPEIGGRQRRDPLMRPLVLSVLKSRSPGAARGCRRRWSNQGLFDKLDDGETAMVWDVEICCIAMWKVHRLGSASSDTVSGQTVSVSIEV
jgi:hypothetical protein